MPHPHLRHLCIYVFQTIMLLLISLIAAAAEEPSYPIRLPGGIQPAIGAWFGSDNLLEPNDYRFYTDLYAEHSPYDLLSTSFRFSKHEMTDPVIHDLVKEAVLYARSRGLDIALDLDVRLARQAFRAQYPDELQEMLRLRTTPLTSSGEAELTIKSETLSDHMTGSATPYIPLASRLIRVYAYRTIDGRIDPATVADITKSCTVKTATDQEIRTAIPCTPSTEGLTACVIVAFTHLTPDVYAPHLIPFQRALIEQYKDVPLAGLMKDEWGFPPCHGGCPPKNDFWFSQARAEAYAAATNGRDLVRDCLLMHAGEIGRECERQAAINILLQTSRERNAAIEDHYYRLTKEFFGPDAAVVTHATWVPYPGPSEYKKNGLSWWAATRDWGQTDEYTPFPARTSLAKKWGGGVWYNQFYSPNVADYEANLWTHALGGGRINYHPLYPNPENISRQQSNYALLEGPLMHGEARIRLIPAITSAPIDCPVAVIFGHACTMNWAGPAYDDAGLELTNALWKAGYSADLIPTSEITSGALKAAPDGSLNYGPQRYAAAVLYHPEFEEEALIEIFKNVNPAQTALFRVGDWTRDFQGNDFDGNAQLPAAMTPCQNAGDAAARVIEYLSPRIPPTNPTMNVMPQNNTICPARKGVIRLIDGTFIYLSGENNPAGDDMFGNFIFGGHSLDAEVQGVLGARFTPDGKLDAFVAGGLRSLSGGGITITALEPRPDIAFWHDAQGIPKGILQDWTGPIPQSLLDLTQDWTRLSSPPPYKPANP